MVFQLLDSVAMRSLSVLDDFLDLSLFLAHSQQLALLLLSLFIRQLQDSVAILHFELGDLNWPKALLMYMCFHTCC